MARLVLAFTFAFVLLPIATGAEPYTPGQPIGKDFNTFAKAFIAGNCLDCHGDTEPEGNLSLRHLGPVYEVNASIWRSVWAQVSLGEMPPKDADQPAIVERLQLTDGIVGEL